MSQMRHCAILSMDNLDDFECYDHLLDRPLAERGWQTHVVSWRDQNVNWDQYEVVIIRSPWDYQEDPELFISVLESIEKSQARLENPLSLVKWNIDKTYLKSLESQGIKIVPTLWRDTFHVEDLKSFFEIFNVDEIVIKPTVSANADNTFRITNENHAQPVSELEHIFKQRPLMAQPFMQSIIDEGEFSLFYFAGNYSHSILKTPQKDDFRVQEEHGGQLLAVTPENELIGCADKVNQALQPQPLYARYDFVRMGDTFAIMEVELIEPSLYFNMDATSPQRFAEAFAAWMDKNH